MIKNLTQFIFVFSFSFAAIVLPTSNNTKKVFKAIKTGKIKALRKNLEKNLVWRIETNKKGMTPLIAAIRKGRLDMVELLMQRGANVNQAMRPNNNVPDRYPINYAIDCLEIDIALELLNDPQIKLFALESSRLNAITTALDVLMDMQRVNIVVEVELLEEEECVRECLEVSKVIKEALNSSKPKRNLRRLSRILHLFFPLDTIAHAITHLQKNEHLKHDENIMLANYYPKIFLSKGVLDSEQMISIIKILYRSQNFKEILTLILLNYKLRQDSFEAYNVLPQKIATSKYKRNKIALELASAIIELHREIFSHISPSILIRAIINEEQIEEYQIAKRAWKRLSLLVQFSILYPTKQKQRVKNYLIWKKVLNLLLNEGDLFGAHPIALGLVSYVVENNVDLANEDIINASIADPTGNFASYRHLEESFNKKFFIPSLIVLSNELTLAGEAINSAKNDDQHWLSVDSIKYFSRTMKKLAFTQETMQQRKFKHKAKFLNAIESFPIPEEEFLQSLGKCPSDYDISLRDLIETNIDQWDLKHISALISKSGIGSTNKEIVFNYFVRKFYIINGASLLKIAPHIPIAYLRAMSSRSVLETFKERKALDLLPVVFEKLEQIAREQGIEIYKGQNVIHNENIEMIKEMKKSYNALFENTRSRRQSWNPIKRSKSLI